MTATLKIIEPNGRVWDTELADGTAYTIGRAKESDIVLNDRRVSRKHARIIGERNGFRLIDGDFENGTLIRSVNHVFVNGLPHLERLLKDGDRILIGESQIEFEQAEQIAETGPGISPETMSGRHVAAADEEPATVNYDDKPLGHTQVQISVNEIIGRQSDLSIESAVPRPKRSRTCGERQRSSNCFSR